MSIHFILRMGLADIGSMTVIHILAYIVANGDEDYMDYSYHIQCAEAQSMFSEMT